MPEGEFPGYKPLGPKPFLDRLMREYRLSEADLRGKLRSHANRSSIGDESFDREYLVHRSVLRSRGEFRCAGDAEARAFCAKVADAMVAARGITRDEAVARINRHWATVWIVGLDIAYHREPDWWADHIYRHTH
jgi:hypothetical protein